MKSPWTIAIAYDHLKPKGFVEYSRDSQALRPLKVGDKVFLFADLPDQPVYGVIRKVKRMMKVNDSYYRITFEDKKRK